MSLLREIINSKTTIYSKLNLFRAFTGLFFNINLGRKPFIEILVIATNVGRRGLVDESVIFFSTQDQESRDQILMRPLFIERSVT